MTIGELKQEIKDLNDDLIVYASDRGGSKKYPILELIRPPQPPTGPKANSRRLSLDEAQAIRRRYIAGVQGIETPIAQEDLPDLFSVDVKPGTMGPLLTARTYKEGVVLLEIATRLQGRVT